MENVALYCRVSTQEQNMNGDSLRMQQENLIKYAKKHNMNIYDIYIDGGYSATSLNRPELQRLLQDVRDKKINRILFIKIDRWSRGVKNYYKLQEVLDENNVHWTTTMENYDTSTTQGKLYINIMLSIAENEANMTRDRINAVFKDKYARGEVCSGKCPRGYKIVDKRLVIDEESALMVQDIFNYYEKTNSLHMTVNYVCNKYEHIHHVTIKKMLTNPLYIGTHEKGFENYCDPIISKEQFDNVQRLLKINVKKYKSKHTSPEFLFSGLLRCKICGRNLAGNRSIRKNSKGTYDYKTYRCNRHFRESTCTNSYQIPETNILEKYLVENIRSELENYIISFKATQNDKKTNNNTSIKNNIKKKLERLKDLYLDDLIDKETYKRDYESLNNQLQELEQQDTTPLKHDLKALEEFLSFDIINIYKTLTISEKRRLWLSIIDYIEVGTSRDDITIHFL